MSEVDRTLKEEWGGLCYSCGHIVFPGADAKKMDGITVSTGVCPRCEQTKTIVPIRDWRVANGEPVMWD